MYSIGMRSCENANSQVFGVIGGVSGQERRGTEYTQDLTATTIILLIKIMFTSSSHHDHSHRYTQIAEIYIDSYSYLYVYA